jgi:hypothetical protein
MDESQAGGKTPLKNPFRAEFGKSAAGQAHKPLQHSEAEKYQHLA